MNVMKGKDCVKAEDSLREFILNEYSKSTIGIGANLYKYKGLSLEVEWEMNVDPYFKVQIMAFEASFKIESGEKIMGGLSDNDASIIQKWAKQSANQTILMRAWQSGAKETNDVKLKPFDMI